MSGPNYVRRHALLKVAGSPSYVGDADAQAQLGTVPPNCWADATGRRFPHHTKQATYTSVVDAFDAGLTAGPVMDRLKLAASHFGIAKDVEDAITKLAAAAQVIGDADLPDSDFLLVKAAGTTQLRKFAAYDEKSTVHACSALVENRARYPRAWRKEAALAGMAKAQQFGIALPAYLDDALNKMAGFGFASEATVIAATEQRRELLGVHSQASEKLASFIDTALSDPETLVDSTKLAGVLDAFDEIDTLAGFVDRYADGGLGLPEDVIVAAPRQLKQAKEQAHQQFITLANGKVIDMAKVAAHSLAVVDPRLSKLSPAKLAAELPKLDVASANLLCRVA